jgi:hypothetical protein
MCMRVVSNSMRIISGVGRRLCSGGILIIDSAEAEELVSNPLHSCGSAPLVADRLSWFNRIPSFSPAEPSQSSR